MNALNELSLSELARRVERREASCVESVSAALDRISQTDDELGAFLRVRGDEALQEAAQADEARALLEPVLATAREMGEIRIEGLALGNLARVESIAGNVDVALDYMDQLVGFSVEHPDERTEILTREQMAVLLERLGRYKEALRCFDEALERNQLLDLGADDRRDALLRQKGWTLVQLGDDFGAIAAWAAASPAPVISTLSPRSRAERQ